jgi:hypothetical protein
MKPKCCGREMIMGCECGQNAHCPVCNIGRGQIPCECSSPWDVTIAGVLTDYEELWLKLADNDTTAVLEE